MKWKTSSAIGVLLLVAYATAIMFNLHFVLGSAGQFRWKNHASSSQTAAESENSTREEARRTAAKKKSILRETSRSFATSRFSFPLQGK